MKYTTIKMVKDKETGITFPQLRDTEFSALPFIIDEQFAEKLYREVIRTKLCDDDRKEGHRIFDRKSHMLAEHYGIKISTIEFNDGTVIEKVDERSRNMSDVHESLRKVFMMYHMLYAGHYFDGSENEDGSEHVCTYAVQIETLRNMCNTWDWNYGNNADGKAWTDEQKKLFNDIKDELEKQAQERLNDKAVTGIRKGYSIKFKPFEVKTFINGCLSHKKTEKDGRYKLVTPSKKSENFAKYFADFILSDTKKEKKAEKIADCIL